MSVALGARLPVGQVTVAFHRVRREGAEVGVIASPAKRVSRRVTGENPGDISSLENPRAVEEIRAKKSV